MELRRYSYERLDGSIRAEERFAAIRSFSRQSDKGSLNSQPDGNGAFVFMISTRAGGVGLNLVAADTVSFKFVTILLQYDSFQLQLRKMNLESMSCKMFIIFRMLNPGHHLLLHLMDWRLTCIIAKDSSLI